MRDEAIYKYYHVSGQIHITWLPISWAWLLQFFYLPPPTNYKCVGNKLHTTGLVWVDQKVSSAPTVQPHHSQYVEDATGGQPEIPVAERIDT